MQYVGIDLETTGLDPDNCQVVELGAVIDDLKTPLHQLPKFRYRVKEPCYRGEPYALSLHADLFREIAAHRDDPDNFDDNDVIDSEDHLTFWFAEWLKKNGVDGCNFVAAGQNFANFDALFLRLLPKSDRIKWHHRVLEAGPMFVRATDKFLPDTMTCVQRAGIDISDIPGKPHTAIYDILVTCALIRSRIV